MDKMIPKFKGIKAYEEEMANTSATDETIDTQKPLKRKSEEIDPMLKSASNEKRLKSLKERLDFDKRQQLLVKKSINDCNKRVNKRIVFSEDNGVGDQISDLLTAEKLKTSVDSSAKSKSKGKQLFESDSEDEDNEAESGSDGKQRLKDFDLDLNKKISDKNAEKLIELNSRFAHDLRFRIDDRFLDPIEDNDEEVDESQKNLNLLEGVLGKSLKPIIKSKDTINESNNKNHLFVSRFDPKSDKSSEYEVNTSSDKKSKRVSFDQKVLDKESKKSTEELDPKVSNEVYFEVSSSLKESFTQKEDEFSLSKMFGSNSSSAETEDNTSEQTFEPIFENIVNNKRKLEVMSNPFRYDSSSSDDEEEEDVEVVVGSASNTSADKPKPFLKGLKFFFDKNDSRFTEDLFYSKELIEKAKNSWKERQKMIIRSIAVRKRSAKKNKKWEQNQQKIYKTKNNYKNFKTNQ